MRLFYSAILVAAALAIGPDPSLATQAKLDPETCNSLRLEQIKFRQSGVLDDMSKGAAWAKANLPPDRLREIAHYLELDEQVRFGCRDAKVTAEAKRASEAAARIEINSDADPTAPVAKDPPKPATAAKDVPKKSAKKKSEKKSAKTSKGKESKADEAPHPPIIVQSQSEVSSGSAAQSPSNGGSSNSDSPTLPAFGFGASEALPWASP